MDSHAVRVTNSLLAAIPSVLGFLPTESVILLATVPGPDGASVLGPVVRADLGPMLAHPAAAADILGTRLADVPVLQLWIVVTTTSHTGREPHVPFRDTVSAFMQHLAGLGFSLLEAIYLPSFTPGAPWRCYHDPDHAGVLPDPATSPATSAAVASGLTIAKDRDELTRRFTPAAAQVRAQVRPVVIDTLEHIRAQIRACSITELAARALLIDDVVARARTGHLPDDSGSIGALIATLTTPLLRDTQLVRRSTEDGLALENLVLHLWRHASEPCASALAGLVAVLAYQRGDGTGANIALSVVDSPDTFTQLIGQAVGLAVHPSELRAVSHQAGRAARSLLRLPHEPRPTDEVHNG